MLDIFPIVRCFIKQVVLGIGALKDITTCMLEMMDCLDVLVRIRHGDKKESTARELHAKTKTYLQTFQAVHGHDRVKPKHHYSIHLGPQMIRHGGNLLGTFTLERKHQAAKATGAIITTTRSYERSLTSRLINLQMTALDEMGNIDGDGNYLFDGHRETIDGDDFVFATSARLAGQEVREHDFAWLVTGGLVRICGIALSADLSWTQVLVQSWMQHDAHRYAPTESFEWVLPDAVLSLTAFSLLQDGRVIVP